MVTVINSKNFDVPRIYPPSSKSKSCSGQLKLATVLEFSQYNRSDSLGVKPPLY